MDIVIRGGVARLDITPPVGISMVGYYIREGVSQAVQRPLTATALVLEAAGYRFAIIACDIAFIQDPAARKIREQIAKAIDTSVDAVWMNYSHTHCGPTLPGFLWQDEDQDRLQRAYLATLTERLIEVTRQAAADTRPVRLGVGSGSAPIGINRRERGEDGKFYVGENPAGPVDHEVVVVRIDEVDGRPLAILFNHPCHTVTMGPKCLQLSPDFVGPARDVIEKSTGAMSLFLQGAAGNINPSTGIGSQEDDSENMMRLGQILGGAVVQTMAATRTHQYRGPRTFLSSLARVSLFPYLPIADKDPIVRKSSVPLSLPMLPLPSLEEAGRIRQARVDTYEQAKRDGKPEGILTVLRHFANWGEKLERTVVAGGMPAIPFEINAIRLGDTAMVSVPCEPLVELGLAVKKASPFAATLFLGYTNGCIGYLSPADAYPTEGWSPWETYAIPDMLFQSYQLPMALEPKCGQMVVDHASALLRQLAD